MGKSTGRLRGVFWMRRRFHAVNLLLAPAHFIDGLINLISFGMLDPGLTARVSQTLIRTAIKRHMKETVDSIREEWKLKKCLDDEE